MKNYYEILEVDKNASQEVIDKAYRTLVKKYHPDLQQGAQRSEYAEKMKNINEAYDVLGDSYKRQQYNQYLQDEKIEKQTISREEQERILQENYILKQKLNNIGNNRQQQVYHDTHIQNWKNREYKHDLKYYIKLIKVITITIFACFLIYQIPFVKQFFQTLYKNNEIFQIIVDIFKNTFSVNF